MISRADDPNRGSKRIFRIALVISLLIHPLIFALLSDWQLAFRQPPDAARPRHPVRNEIVTISTSPRHRPITVAQAQAPSHRTVRPSVARPKRIPRPQRVPHPLVRPQPVVVPKVVRVPRYPTPAPLRHELAKLDKAKAQPKPETPRPQTPTPHTPTPETPAPKAIAAVQRPDAVQQVQPPVTPRTRSAPSRYSEAQIAQIESDLAKSIRASRGENNPLSNVSKQVAVAAAPKRYPIDFQAVEGNLRSAQGVCDPIKSWTADGWDYYWAACNVVEPDGSMRRKPMPWPVRWRPRDDPWNGNYVSGQGPMPLPPPGWHSDPAHPVDADFMSYLRQRGYAI